MPAKTIAEMAEAYQKVTQLEHVLLRPETYIGSMQFTDKTPMWIYDSEEDKLVRREISYVPGLYKIFDEILVNAAVVDQLVKLKFKPDPVKKWKDLQKKNGIAKRGEDAEQLIEEDEDDESEVDKDVKKRVSDYAYLLDIPTRGLSIKNTEKRMGERDAKLKELKILQGKTWSDLWEEDLAVFLKALDAKEKKDAEELQQIFLKADEKLNKGTTKGAESRVAQTNGLMQSLPSSHAAREPPCINVMKHKFNEKLRSEDKAAGIMHVPDKKVDKAVKQERKVDKPKSEDKVRAEIKQKPQQVRGKSTLKSIESSDDEKVPKRQPVKRRIHEISEPEESSKEEIIPKLKHR